LLRKIGGGETSAEALLAMLERQVNHLVRLVDDLLEVSRISRGKIELKKERVDLAAVVDHALETSRPLIEAGGHVLNVFLPSESLVLEADPVRLAQVLANLLNNAAKYTESGGIIAVTAERQGREALVRVRDSGIGISEAMLGRVFDLFSQVDQSLEKTQGGLGIGLHLAKRLVELHGGSLEAHSEGLGRGSEFVVRLPVADEGAESRPAPAPERAGAGAESRRRVLVADDNEDAVSSLAQLLEIMGHEVRTAADGRQAVEAAAAFRPELILLDIGMPRLNGYDACRLIRAQPWGREPVIAALTGWGQDRDKARSREAGFDNHLVKPVEPADLERLLESVGAAG
jgi:CheY-like chemotaxis protein/two-component sensor histidine kinase